MLRAVCLDFGDTLADEASETRDAGDRLASIDLVPGARETLDGLRERGYRLALIADGPSSDLRTAIEQHGLAGVLDAIAISEEVGAEKPSPRMFRRALDQIGVRGGEAAMVGNRLERDIRGARALGMRSVWMDWSPRYGKLPGGPEEVPDHVIREPLELLPLLDGLSWAGAS